MAEQVSPVKYFLCGGFGGICTVLSGHPLDTIKVRLQTMPTPPPGQEPMFKGTFDCAAKTVKNEGFKGLYKGMSAPLTGIAPIFAISFFGFGLGKRLLQKADEKLSYTDFFLAGAFSGIFTTTIMAPGERVKCLLQIQQGGTGPKKYNGMLDCAKKLWKEGGIRSIYKGTCATLLRDIPASGMYFCTYEIIQDQFKKRSGTDKIGLMPTIFAGGAAGISYWIVGMPPDVLKSRLQTSPEGKYPNGIRSVFKELMKVDGAGALYRGVTPVMLRAFPANAACFFGFELCMRMLNVVAPGL